jgi:hypothetical protein
MNEWLDAVNDCVCVFHFFVGGVFAVEMSLSENVDASTIIFIVCDAA